MNNITNWDDILKKEARGTNDYDLGEVHEVEPEIVVTKKGVVDKDKFYLPVLSSDLTDTKFGFLSPKRTLKTIEKTNICYPQ